MLKYYSKILAPYKRTDGNKLLDEGVFQIPEIEMLADSKIWIGTEKIDGTNTAIYWDGHEFTLHGHSSKSEYQPGMEDLFKSIWLTNEMEEKVEELFGEKEVIFYGETYGGRIGGNGKLYSPDKVKFILFDVYFPNSDIWLRYDNVCEIAYNLGLDVVQVFKTNVTLYELIDVVKSQPLSKESDKLTIEGLVARPVYELRGNGKRLITKIKCKDFKTS